MRKVRVVLFLFACVGVLTAPAAADPITVTGSMVVGSYVPQFDQFAGASIDLTGEGFALAGNSFQDRVGVTPNCALLRSCAAGTAVTLDSSLQARTIAGPATVGGTSYTLTRSDVFGDFTLGPVAVPASAAATFDLQAPFSFTGFANIFELGQTPSSLGRVDLVGQGTATIAMAQFSDGGFGVTGVRFDLDAAASPTPEPASLLLLGTGTALLWRRSRRVRNAG